MLDDGMKVLAVAYKKTDKKSLDFNDENDLILLGYLAFFDAPKKSAASAVEKLHNLNINVKVLTGDQKSVAVSICKRLGISIENCLTGREIESLSEDELTIRVENTMVFAELSPKQKATELSY